MSTNHCCCNYHHPAGSDHSHLAGDCVLDLYTADCALAQEVSSLGPISRDAVTITVTRGRAATVSVPVEVFGA